MPLFIGDREIAAEQAAPSYTESSPKHSSPKTFRQKQHRNTTTTQPTKPNTSKRTNPTITVLHLFRV
ncbi:hypothetical protein GX563_08820 [Candidatus Bathyarchaeota archaeon]|nr:hypothetical protein [Candidatus Bathyarchaeota archaeon]